jgi:copper chaperone
MHCGSCGVLIDDALEETAGVRRASTIVRARRTVVEVDAHADVATLIAVINSLGYTAHLDET